MLTFGMIFWLLMLLWLIYGFWSWMSPNPNWVWGNSAFLFVLFFLLGWHVFGAAVRP